MLATRDVGHRPADAPRSSFSVPRHDDPAFLDPYVVAVFVPDAAFGNEFGNLALEIARKLAQHPWLVLGVQDVEPGLALHRQIIVEISEDLLEPATAEYLARLDVPVPDACGR